MTFRYTKYIMAALVAVFLCPAMAQNGVNSPYSRYGFGLLSDNSSGFNKGMGGAGLGTREGTVINFRNPASYSAVDSLSFLFDVGMSLQNANFSENGHKANAHNAGVDYLNVAFRAWQSVGMAIGFMPYSNIGYEFSGSETLADNDGYGEKTATTSYSGDGGLHQLYLGIGWEPVKHLSVGMNASYLWGNYSHIAKVAFSENSIQPLRRNYSANISTYKLDFGLQYGRRIGKKDALTLGLTYGLGHSIDNKAQFINQILSSSGNVASADTINTSSAFELPHSFGIGATWNHDNRWTVALDYSLEMWSKVKFPQLVDDNNDLRYDCVKGLFDDRHKVALGAEYLPNVMGIHYKDHIRYRAGVSYSTSYTKVNGQSGADDFCVSLGVGLPISNMHNNRSVLNVSAQWEHVKPRTAGLITENYLRLCIGLSFNERWFMKWKVE